MYEATYQVMTLDELTKSRQSAFFAMRNSVKDGMRPWRLDLQERFDWLRSVLPPDPVEFCEEDWFRAVETVWEQFPEQPRTRVQTIGGY